MSYYYVSTQHIINIIIIIIIIAHYGAFLYSIHRSRLPSSHLCCFQFNMFDQSTFILINRIMFGGLKHTKIRDRRDFKDFIRKNFWLLGFIVWGNSLISFLTLFTPIILCMFVQTESEETWTLMLFCKNNFPRV